MSQSAMPRRFYDRVDVVQADSGFALTLDGRALKTAAGASFIAPTRALAELCAREWEGQGEYIDVAAMATTKLAFAAIDLTRGARSASAEYVASFGATDLCCHRAMAPAELVARQAAAWDTLVAWGEERLRVSLPVVTGVIAGPVLPGTVAAIAAHALEADDFRLTALSQAAGLSGSCLIAFALLHQRLSAEGAFAAAALDDLWSLEQWGEDAEASARLERLRIDLDAVVRFITVLGMP